MHSIVIKNRVKTVRFRQISQSGFVFRLEFVRQRHSSVGNGNLGNFSNRTGSKNLLCLANSRLSLIPTSIAAIVFRLVFGFCLLFCRFRLDLSDWFRLNFRLLLDDFRLSLSNGLRLNFRLLLDDFRLSLSNGLQLNFRLLLDRFRLGLSNWSRRRFFLTFSSFCSFCTESL